MWPPPPAVGQIWVYFKTWMPPSEDQWNLGTLPPRMANLCNPLPLFYVFVKTLHICSMSLFKPIYCFWQFAFGEKLALPQKIGKIWVPPPTNGNIRVPHPPKTSMHPINVFWIVPKGLSINIAWELVEIRGVTYFGELRGAQKCSSFTEGLQCFLGIVYLKKFKSILWYDHAKCFHVFERGLIVYSFEG